MPVPSARRILGLPPEEYFNTNKEEEMARQEKITFEVKRLCAELEDLQERVTWLTGQLKGNVNPLLAAANNIELARSFAEKQEF